MLSLLFAAELVLLYLLSQQLTKKLYVFVILVTNSNAMALSFISALYFPGTVIHELSHLFVAEILRVRTGNLTLVPETIRTGEIQAGSVMIARTDPFRRYAIGLAPGFVGLIVISAIAYFLPQVIGSVRQAYSLGTLFTDPSLYLFLFLCYSLFVVSNSMFSSKADLEGFWGFAIAVGIIAVSAYIAGFRVTLPIAMYQALATIFTTLTQSVGIVLAVNVCILLVTEFWMKAAEKITKKKIIYR